MRPDLVVSEDTVFSRKHWVVKDPIALRYFELRNEEMFVLRMLDGRHTFSQIQQNFQTTFSPLKLPLEELQRLLSLFIQSEIVRADTEIQTAYLLGRHSAQRHNRRWSWLTNPLTVRIWSFDPSTLLDAIYPWLKWVFQPIFLLISICLQTFALAVIIVHWDAVGQRWPTFEAFIQPHNMFWLFAAIGIAKAIHELAHALTCKHVGGRCHELGIQLLMFVPCPYTNVTDTWRVQGRFKRAAVSAAGIYAEAILAACSAILWWYTEPGVLNTVALSLSVVCSINTLLINGNPLLRFDGYFVLSDLVRIPNLRQRAWQVLVHWMERFFWGGTLKNERVLPSRGQLGLGLYAIAAQAYGWFVLFGIFWYLHRLLTHYGLAPLTFLLMMPLLYSLLVRGLTRTFQSIRLGFNAPQHSTSRFIFLSSACLVAGIFLLFWPLPHHVAAPVFVEFADAARVYVQEPGRLPRDPSLPCVASGAKVRAGEVLQRLEDTILENDVLRLQAECRAMESRIDSLERTLVQNPIASSQISVAKEAVKNLHSNLEERKEKLSRLTLKSPRDGVVIPYHHQHSRERTGELPPWEGTPLDSNNAGATLERGSVYCLIASNNTLAARILIDEHDLYLVQPGQVVSVWIHRAPRRTLQGKITELGKTKLNEIPEELACLELPMLRDQTKLLPANPVHEVRATLNSIDVGLPLFSSGWARIETEPMSLAGRLLRYLNNTFRFKVGTNLSP